MPEIPQMTAMPEMPEMPEKRRRFALYCFAALVAGAALATITPAAGAESAAPPASRPEPRLEELPGYLPFSELAILPHQDLKMEINLEGPLLELVAGATADDPDLGKLLGGLKAVRVQIAKLKAGTEASVQSRLEQTASWLDQHGWKTIVRARDGQEENFIYTRQVGGRIVGLTVLNFQAGKEAAVINIVGEIDPAQLGRLGRTLSLPELEHVRPPAAGHHDNP